MSMDMTTTGDTDMSDQVLSLGDIPDFSGLGDESPFESFADGWYQGTILGTRTFTDKSGNERIFASVDAPSAKGDSRNIRLQVVLTRKSDGRTLHNSMLVNYRPEDLTQDAVQAVKGRMAAAKASGERFAGDRTSLALSRLSTLQQIAGVRQFQRDTETGGLDISALYNKTAFFRLAPDDRNPLYKAVDKFQPTAPTKLPVL